MVTFFKVKMNASASRKIVLVLSFISLLFVLFIYSSWLSASVITIDTFRGNFEFFNERNDNQPYCRIPKLLVEDPSIKHLLEEKSALKCSSMKNWVYTKDGRFYIEAEAEKEYGKIECNYYDIKRIHENDEEEILHENFTNGSRVLGDGFRVKCNSKRRQYRNVHFTVADLNATGDLKSFPRNEENRLSDLHIFFYIMDSMSRINFIRKLPNFYKFLTNNMSAIVMESFNTVGDGTAWAIIPMTTGHFQNELPEARKRFENSSFLDNWPFIFREYRKAGYGTVYAEEQPQFNPFAYKLKGFNNTPVDHYLRHVLKIGNSEKRFQRAYCLGDTPLSLVWLSYWTELKTMYEKYDRRTLSILFPGETSHDDYNLVQSLDVHLTKGFKKLQDDKLLNNTFLFVMGDHGRRFGPIRQSQTGKLEEKLPFLAVVPPPWFSKVYPESYSNLLKNKNRLLTVFDLHATLKHFLNFTQDGGLGSLNNRAVSILQEIPLQRTCREADIKPHFCGCLDWIPISNPIRHLNVTKAIKFILDDINTRLREANGSCAVLTLKNIISANIFKPKEALLAFKESSDYDNYSPDLSANSEATAIYYQLRFVTSPGDGDWEVTITHYLDLNQFKFTEDNLSRLNSYGDQAKCVTSLMNHLRIFCYCLEKTQ